jgi:hypothetical protein
MRKVALSTVVTTCAMGSVVAADMTAPTSLYKAPAPAYTWIDWYFGWYFAGSARHGWDVSTNPAFAFGYAGRATEFGSEVFPPLLNALSGGGQTGADRQRGNFAGGVSQGVGINASGAVAIATAPRCDVPSARCGSATAQPLFQNLNLSEAIRTTSVPAADNSLSFGIDGSNSDGNYNKRRVTGPGVAGESFMGTFSYKFDWQ